MSEVTAPIMTDATGQSIDGKLNSLLGKMDNLAAAFQPNASGIVYSNTTSGLTGDDVQEAIDEMAADVSEIKQSLPQYYVFDSSATINGNDSITHSIDISSLGLTSITQVKGFFISTSQPAWIMVNTNVTTTPTTLNLGLRNFYSSALTVAIAVRIEYVK